MSTILLEYLKDNSAIVRSIGFGNRREGRAYNKGETTNNKLPAFNSIYYKYQISQMHYEIIKLIIARTKLIAKIPSFKKLLGSFRVKQQFIVAIY